MSLRRALSLWVRMRGDGSDHSAMSLCQDGRDRRREASGADLATGGSPTSFRRPAV